MRQRITQYIRAGYAGLYFVSAEEQRVEAELAAVASELKQTLYGWSATEGLFNPATKKRQEVFDPLETLQTVDGLEKDSLVLLRDFHLFLSDDNPMLLRKLKDSLRAAQAKGSTIMLVGCRLALPPELTREMTVVEFALPGREELRRSLREIVESQNEGKKTGRLQMPQGDAELALLDAASGMTTTEAANAFALSLVEGGNLNPMVVSREKSHAVKKDGLLELVETSGSLDNVGGLENLKAWLLNRRRAFTQRAREYGLPAPKGVLISGIPGCGKSLTAKATASVFGVPLLRLDAGRIFAGVVGQSEANVRAVIQTAEALAPVVLWIDEMEKGFAGSQSSGSTDGGTGSRVFGTFISWMQDKKSPVFIVATANDVSKLPPEMLRKGRWDELFFVDLPTKEERAAIWQIQIQKYGRNPKDFKIEHLTDLTANFTGSEIEQLFTEALFQAFEQDKEPTMETIEEVRRVTVPLSSTMGEQLQRLRDWAQTRTRSATAIIEEATPKTTRRIKT